MVCSDPYGFQFSLFPVQSLITHETISFLYIFCTAQSCNLDYVIYFYKLNKGLSSYYQDFSDRNIWLLLGKYYFMKIFHESTELDTNMLISMLQCDQSSII